MRSGPVAPLSTPDHCDRLTLAQWFSPAFPIGTYAYSQGLEQAIAAGQVTDVSTLKDWVEAVLTFGSGRTDAILLAQGRDADGLADFAYALAITAERRTEMHDQGAAFGQLIEALTGTTQPPLPYALAIGHASRALTVPTQDVVMFFLQSLAAQLISVAVRFMPMGASQGQKLLQQLSALIAVLAQDFAKTPLCDLSNATLGADLAAMRHETMDVRIFRS